MYHVIQIGEKCDVVWCTVETETELKEFCQYLINSMIEGGGEHFIICRDGNNNHTSFYDFCKENGIAKRSFEERMEEK